MSRATFTESIVEDAALTRFEEELGYTFLHGPDIAPGEPGAERAVCDALLPKLLSSEMR